MHVYVTTAVAKDNSSAPVVVKVPRLLLFRNISLLGRLKRPCHDCLLSLYFPILLDTSARPAESFEIMIEDTNYNFRVYESKALRCWLLRWTGVRVVRWEDFTSSSWLSQRALSSYSSITLPKNVYCFAVGK